MFGWKTGAVLGGNYGKDIDVTPDREGVWDDDVSADQRNKIDKDLEQYMSEKYAPIGQIIQETDFIHIPVSSGDGYFRLVVCPHRSARSIIASTGVFRLVSLSSDPARTRGATLGMLAPELALKHASNTVQSAAQGAIYTAIPIVEAVETIPGTKMFGKWALDTGYRRVAGQETRGRYNSLDDVYHHLEDEIHSSVGFTFFKLSNLSSPKVLNSFQRSISVSELLAISEKTKELAMVACVVNVVQQW